MAASVSPNPEVTGATDIAMPENIQIIIGSPDSDIMQLRVTTEDLKLYVCWVDNFRHEGKTLHHECSQHPF
jgi:hypothetical protein